MPIIDVCLSLYSYIGDIDVSEKKDLDGIHDDVITRKHFPRYWPFVLEIHRSPVNSPHKGQWHRALMFSLICTWMLEQKIETQMIRDAIELIMMLL